MLMGMNDNRRHSLTALSAICFSAFLCWIPQALPQERVRLEISGVPVPVSPPEYRQPVTKPTHILQGNHGTFSHSGFNTRYAWDYALHLGTPVAAARSGVVSLIQDQSNIGGSDSDRFSTEVNYILIDHLDGTSGQYCHLQKGSCRVRRGEYVMQGEVIASSGDTGFACCPHLHYTLVDTSTDESLPSRFADFSKNDGVPADGDKVPAGKKPAIPQKAIGEYKKYWRACTNAERLGRIDAAWTFARAGLDKGKHPDYFYHRVLLAREERLREKLLARLTTFASLDAPSPPLIGKSHRMLESLAKVKDGELRARLNSLKKRMRTWKGDAAVQWQKETRAVQYWAEGVRYECLEEFEAAVEEYAKACRCSSGPFKEETKTALRRLLILAENDYMESFTRLEHETEIALLQHKNRIDTEARKALGTYQKFLRVWGKLYPGEPYGDRASSDSGKSRRIRISNR